MRAGNRLALAALVAGALLGVAGPAGAVAKTSTLSVTVDKPPVPAILTVVESSAEDLVDYALSGNRSEVIVEATTLRSTAQGPAAVVLGKSGVSKARVAQLEQRAARVAQLAPSGSFIRIALAANAVSQLMPILYRQFGNRVPATILELDFLDREAQLRSLARQPKRVAWAIAELQQTWLQVRPKVIGAGGADEAGAYDRHVAAMKRLEPDSGRSVQAEAERGLALVDELERVFSR